MTTTEGTFTTSDGVELFTRSWVNHDSRYNILLVHGLGEHTGRWIEPMDQLVARGASVYSYDLRGHGLSKGGRMDVPEFEAFHRDIAEMAEATVAKSSKPWVLYGHSLGGLQCAGYLMDGHTPLPAISVLSAPALSAEVPAFLRLAASVLGRIIPTMRVAGSITGDQLAKIPEVGERYFADELVETKVAARLGKEMFDEQARLEPVQGTINVPTFVIHGADDPLVPPSASAGLAKSSSVERKLYPTLRHEMHNEAEGPEVMSDVADWIDAALGF